MRRRASEKDSMDNSTTNIALISLLWRGGGYPFAFQSLMFTIIS
jgi:hypothetical protein